MKFPIHDWQFSVATAIALVALLWLLRRFLPGSKSRKRSRGRRTSLTIEGRAVQPHEPAAASHRPDNG